MKAKQFIDETVIRVQSGNGGDGLATFHKEKGISRGGPSGGDGGDGGSVIFEGDSGENTLLEFKTNRLYKADNGKPGGANNRTGARGEDLIIKVPLGTQVYEDGVFLFEITKDKERAIVVNGGKGGRGNSSFKSAKSPSPMLYEAGEKGTLLNLKLNLKLLADIGLLGFPNAGKSTFISVVSNAKPKIANYEFTTLTPNLGLVKHNDFKFVVSDLPGLIKGASENKGMGIQFLKHMERTKIILHLIDVTNLELVKRYKILRKELENYSSDLAKKKELIILTKNDLVDYDLLNLIEDEINELRKENPVFVISSLTRDNLNNLLNEIVDVLKVEEQDASINDEEIIFEYKPKIDNNDLSFETEKVGDRDWIISGQYVEYWGNRIPMTNTENFWRLYKKLESKGVIAQLMENGLKEGDYIRINGTSFELQYFDDE